MPGVGFDRSHATENRNNFASAARVTSGTPGTEREERSLNWDDGIPPLPSLASIGKNPARCKMTKYSMPVRNKKIHEIINLLERGSTGEIIFAFHGHINSTVAYRIVLCGGKKTYCFKV